MVVKVSGQSEELWGSVSSVSSAEIATSSHAIVRYVTVEVTNPGALNTSDTASVTVDGIACQDTAAFEYINTDTITAKTQGKIYSLNIQKNDRVYKDTVVVNLSSTNAESSAANAAIELDNAEMTLQEMGTTTISVNIQSRGTTKKVEPQEMFDLINSDTALFSNVSPNVMLSGSLKTSDSGDDTITASCTGVSEHYGGMKDLKISFGRFLQYIDCEREMKTCVIGTYEALYFFNSSSAAVDKYLKINGVPYKIVGILEETEDSSQSSADDVVYIPYTTSLKANGTKTVSSYTVTATDESVVTDAVNAIKALLMKKIGDEDYFTVTSMLSMIDNMSSMMDSMGTVLIAIAAISLLVGGIGIMNIMLVSVTERTREIGIRKSLGAKHKHILMQFVIEAGTVSCMGGIFGIILGCIVSLIAGHLLDMETNPSIGAIMLAFGVSVGIGIAFGFLPARKAAQLNPIDALKFE